MKSDSTRNSAPPSDLFKLAAAGQKAAVEQGFVQRTRLVAQLAGGLDLLGVGLLRR